MNDMDTALVREFEHSTNVLRQSVEDLLLEREAMEYVIAADGELFRGGTMAATKVGNVNDMQQYFAGIRSAIKAGWANLTKAATVQPDGSCIPRDAVPVGEGRESHTSDPEPGDSTD